MAYRYAYTRFATGRPPVGLRSFAEEIAKSVFIASLLHAGWIGLSGIVGSPVDLFVVAGLVTGSQSEGTRTVAVLAESSGKILIYFGSLLPASVIIGAVVALLVRHNRLDKIIPFMRVGDDWHYVLLGEYQELVDPWHAPARADVVATAAVEIAGKAYLYLGVLEEFYYDRDGELDRIVLVGTHRRELLKDKAAEESSAAAKGPPTRFYPIDGDYVVIPYREIRNLNIRYVFAQIDEEALGEVSDSGMAPANTTANR